MRIGRYSAFRKVALLLVCSCTLTGCEYIFSTGQDSAEDKGPRRIYALGRLEPADGIIDITAIPGERLQQLDPDVRVNGLVPEDGVLGLLASYDLGKAQLKALSAKKNLAVAKHQQDVQMVKARKAQAQASLADAHAKKSALPFQKAKLDLLKDRSDLAVEKHKRMKELSESDPQLVNRLDLDEKENDMKLAIQDREIAADKLASATEIAKKAIAAAKENLQVVLLSEEQLKAEFDTKAVDKEIDVAKVTLRQSILLSPHVSASSLQDVLNVECIQDHDDEPGVEATDARPYTVLKVFLSRGESVSRTPIMQVADLRSMVCIAEVHEANVKEIAVKQGVTIRSPSFSGDFADGPLDEKTRKRSGGMRGTVQSISRIIAPPDVQNRNPLAPADRKVVEVRISIDDPAAVAHARSFVSMDVTVEFDEEKPKTKEAVKDEEADSRSDNKS